MNRWVLQARAVVRRPDGQLRRNDTVTDQGDDRAALTRQADRLAADGYTVWLFERRRVGLGHSALHLVDTITPEPHAGGDRR